MSEQEDRFFIPRTIKVGYQERDDTYTGKLAYVIYIDQHNKVRKEKSWNSWRDDDIEPNDFKNEPTEGFVLNKHVGGYSSGWDFRQSYCRIYDPRGFEFEISIENLLWILEFEDCYHGKGLSGKFVYGWIQDELVLIPCVTEDYKVSFEMSEKMFEHDTFKKDELIPGSSYKVKGGDKPIVYVGNLKFQKRLGDGYSSKLVFYDPDNNISRSLYGYQYNWHKERDVYQNTLVTLNKSSILCKVADDVLSKDEVDELVHRFNLTAYSYNFWHTKNFIAYFTHKNSSKFQPETYYFSSDSYRDEILHSIISPDGKSVEIYKTEEYYEKTVKETVSWNGRHWSNVSYEHKKRQYKFITLNTNGDLNKICDFGKVYGNRYSYNEYNYEFDEIYRNPKKSKQFEGVYAKSTDKLTSLYYMTNDGYFSDSLNDCLFYQSLSFITDDNVFDIIHLPVKIKEETK